MAINIAIIVMFTRNKRTNDPALDLDLLLLSLSKFSYTEKENQQSELVVNYRLHKI